MEGLDVDRQGDVRVLANVRPNERWMGTLLHELGHAVYSKYHDRALPFLLREAAHMFITELVFMRWGLVRRLQKVIPPEGRDKPDYTSKIHLGSAPVYYQNYLLGSLAASQIRAALREQGCSEGLAGDRKTGEFLRQNIFRIGALYPWNEMLRRATGRPLSPEPFLREFLR